MPPQTRSVKKKNKTQTTLPSNGNDDDPGAKRKKIHLKEEEMEHILNGHEEGNEMGVVVVKESGGMERGMVVALEKQHTTLTSSSSSSSSSSLFHVRPSPIPLPPSITSNTSSKRKNNEKWTHLYLPRLPHSSWRWMSMDAIELAKCLLPPPLSPLDLVEKESTPSIPSHFKTKKLSVTYQTITKELEAFEVMHAEGSPRPTYFLYLHHPVRAIEFFQNRLAILTYPDFLNTPYIPPTPPNEGSLTVWQTYPTTRTSPTLLDLDPTPYQCLTWIHATQLSVCDFQGTVHVMERVGTMGFNQSGSVSEQQKSKFQFQPVARPLVMTYHAPWLMLGCVNGVVAMYSLQGHCLGCFHTHDGFITSLSVVKHCIGTTGADGRVCLQDIRQVGKRCMTVAKSYAILQTCFLHPSLDLFLFADVDDSMKGCHPTDTRTLSFIRHPSTIMKIRGTSVHPFMISVGMDGGVYLCNVARVRSKSVKPHRVLVFQLKVNPVNEEGILIEDTIVSEPVSFSASTKLEDNCIKNIPMSLALFAADWNHQSPDQSHWFAAGGASGLVILSAAPTK